MNANELKKTALWETHNAAGGKMVDFAGWSMPIQYSDGIVTEANAVRTNAGLFDVSHMGRVEYRGAQAEQLMEWLLGADISKLKEGFAKYTLLCDEHGNIIDDCIVYKMADHFLLIINAARHDVDTAWIENQRVRFSETESVDVTASMAMIAFQGPRAIAIMDELTGGACSELKKFSAAHRPTVRRRRTRRPHRLHRRRRTGDYAAQQCRSPSLAATRTKRCCSVRTRRARRSAPRSRPDALRQRH